MKLAELRCLRLRFIGKYFIDAYAITHAFHI